MLDSNVSNQETNLATGALTSSVSYADALENYRKNTDWWVVFAAFDLPDFESSPLWIANRTNLSVEAVVEALEGLAVLGFLKKDRGNFETIKGKNFINLDIQSRKKSEVFAEHALISQQILNQLNENMLAAIDHRCFASNVDILKDLYSDISIAFEKAFKNSENAKIKDRVFKMTFTAADVLKKEGAVK